MLIILIMIVAAFYFILYHKIVTVIYFENMIVHIVFELLACFVLSIITLGFIKKIIMSLLMGVGKVVGILVTITLFVLVAGGIIYGIYKIYSSINQKIQPEVKADYADNTESPEDENMIICPECGNICSFDTQFCDQCGHSL